MNSRDQATGLRQPRNFGPVKQIGVSPVGGTALKDNRTGLLRGSRHRNHIRNQRGKAILAVMLNRDIQAINQISVERLSRYSLN